MVNEAFSLRDRGWSNALGTGEIPRHRWYFVKEGFSSELVRAAIEDTRCDEDSQIFDPFCGSGTVPLTSNSEGMRTAGLEINPFLAFVAKTKLVQCRADLFSDATAEALDGATRSRVSPLEKFSTFCEQPGKRRWLFNRSVLRAFEGAWNCTYRMPDGISQLVRLALLGAAIDNCNAIRDGKCLRYRNAQWERNWDANSFIYSAEQRASTIAADLESSPIDKASSRIIRGDARAIMSTSGLQPFKLCVTSPPYLNSFDYSDIYRPELFLGRFVRSNADLRRVRNSTIRSHLQVNWRKPRRTQFGKLYANSLQEISSRSDLLWNKKIPTMIQAYFEDLEVVLGELRKNARPDASLWLVVSTSAYAGVEVPVDLIIADIASKMGWYLREVGVLRYMRTAGQHWHKWNSGEKPRLRESVVILDASKHGLRRRPAK